MRPFQVYPFITTDVEIKTDFYIQKPPKKVSHCICLSETVLDFVRKIKKEGDKYHPQFFSKIEPNKHEKHIKGKIVIPNSNKSDENDESDDESIE